MSIANEVISLKRKIDNLKEKKIKKRRNERERPQEFESEIWFRFY